MCSDNWTSKHMGSGACRKERPNNRVPSWATPDVTETVNGDEDGDRCESADALPADGADTNTSDSDAESNNDGDGAAVVDARSDPVDWVLHELDGVNVETNDGGESRSSGVTVDGGAEADSDTSFDPVSWMLGELTEVSMDMEGDSGDDLDGAPADTMEGSRNKQSSNDDNLAGMAATETVGSETEGNDQSSDVVTWMMGELAEESTASEGDGFVGSPTTRTKGARDERRDSDDTLDGVAATETEGSEDTDEGCGDGQDGATAVGTEGSNYMDGRKRGKQ